MRRPTKTELVLILIILGLLLSGYVIYGGYHILGIGETIKIGCITDHLDWTDTGTEYFEGIPIKTGLAHCWIITTQ